MQKVFAPMLINVTKWVIMDVLFSRAFCQHLLFGSFFPLFISSLFIYNSRITGFLSRQKLLYRNNEYPLLVWSWGNDLSFALWTMFFLCLASKSSSLTYSFSPWWGVSVLLSKCYFILSFCLQGSVWHAFFYFPVLFLTFPESCCLIWLTVNVILVWLPISLDLGDLLNSEDFLELFYV